VNKTLIDEAKFDYTSTEIKEKIEKYFEVMGTEEGILIRMQEIEYALEHPHRDAYAPHFRKSLEALRKELLELKNELDKVRNGEKNND